MVDGCADTTYTAAFTNLTIPLGETCSMFKTSRTGSMLHMPCYGTVSNETVACTDYVFDDSEFLDTAVTEFHLVCGEKWQQSVISSVYMIGVLFGSFGFGLISDKYGRRSVYYWAPLVGAVFALMIAFADNVAMFAAGSFFVATCCTGLYLVGFILGVEMVGDKYRVWCANGYQVMRK